ncbi:type II toxin-antitoxin system RelB/DinJ family antitoxin [Treponema sp. R80B11-R83G3]
MATTSITIRMDKNLKKQAETLFDELGINMTTAFTIFTKTAVRQQKIPFELTADPFFNEENQARLRKAAKDMEAGRGIVRKTLAELEALENE